MRTYEYDSGVFARKITFTAGFCALIFTYSIFNLITGKSPILWLAAAVVSGYFVWETFVSIANPSKVEIDDKGITFSAYKKSHHYDWAEINKFKSKPLSSGTKMFVRINDAGIFRGRYWVNCYYFNNGEELAKFLFKKEMEVEPEGLRAKSVQGSEQSKKIKKQKYDCKKQMKAQKQLEKQIRKNAAKNK